jgi:hypothetical protein
VFGGAHEGGDLDRCKDRRIEEEWEEAGVKKKGGEVFYQLAFMFRGWCVPVEEGCEGTDERVAEEQERRSGKARW